MSHHDQKSLLAPDSPIHHENDQQTSFNQHDEVINSLHSDQKLGLSQRKSAELSLSQRSHPPDPVDAIDRKSVLKSVAGYILVTEFCERLAYYGFAGSLVLFFQTQLGYSNAEADVQYSAWSGFCYLTPLMGGYLADSYLGRYRAILIFSSIYLFGLVLVVFGSIPDHISPAVFFPAIYIVAIGTGGIKPNVCTMGADQFDDRYSQDRKEKESFFNWFYWSINLGSLISYTLVAYICQYGLPFLGGEKWGFFVGYCIPAIMMGVAILIFFSGTSKYRSTGPPRGSVLAQAVHIIIDAYWTKRGQQAAHPLDRSKASQGGAYKDNIVEGVALTMRLLPFLAAFVPYWGVYSQMSTAFQNQGCQMDLDMDSISIPVSALNCFDTLAILLLVPVFDMYLYPLLKKKGWGAAEDGGWSMLQKIGLGFAVAMVAMLVAAIVEIMRKRLAPSAGGYFDTSARDNITPCQSIDDYNPLNYQKWYSGDNDTDKPANCHQTCDTTVVTDDGEEVLAIECISCDNIPQMSHMSVFWQVPQFVLLGCSEILASITSLEFFYSQAPTVMRSVSQSLNLATTAVGTFLLIPLIYMVNADKSSEWVPLNLDDGHLDWYFFLLAAVMLLDVFYLGYIAKEYVYMTEQDLKGLEEDFGDDIGSGDGAGLDGEEGVGESPLMSAHAGYRAGGDKSKKDEDDR